MSAIVRNIVTVLLLVVGVQLWLIVGGWEPGRPPGPIVWAAILLVALVPPVNRRIVPALEWIAHPSPRARLIVAVVLALVAGVYLYFTAVAQQRDFFLKIHDEHSYAIQARMLASGRLWLAPHPVAESFDSPYVIVRPVYASMYFPGTALMLVPAVWFGLPWWVTPLVVSAACVGVLYRVVTELIDGVAGLLAALMLVSLQTFRELSLRLYSQTPMLLLALCLIWAWLAWRRDPRWPRALIIGVLAGWMLIVRPLDALIFLIPLAIVIALERRKLSRQAIAAIMAGAFPFLSLQLIANRGVTGSWLTTPHAFYAERDFPGVTLGFHTPRPMSMLATTVPQKRAFYRDAISAIEKHRPGNVLPELFRNRLPLTVSATLPNNLLVILLPLGVAALFVRTRASAAWVFAAPLLLFVLAYGLYLFYFAHYLLVVAPAMIFLIVLAVRELPAMWPHARNALAVLLTLAIATLSIYALPQFHRTLHDDVGAGDLGQINKLIAELPHRPAIVLFRWADDISVQREPVYNVDTANIDHADVIRAHDLPGEPNRKLLEYYASRQPRRHVYLVIRMPDDVPPQVEYLGLVGTLSQATTKPL
jgi:hypothetical protein